MTDGASSTRRKLIQLTAIVAVLGLVTSAILWPIFEDQIQKATRDRLTEQLRRCFGPHVHYESLDFSRLAVDYTLRVRNVQVWPDSQTVPGREILVAEQVAVRFYPWLMVKLEQPRIEEIVFTAPHIFLRDEESGYSRPGEEATPVSLNLHAFLAAVEAYRATHGPVATGTGRLPRVLVQEGTLHLDLPRVFNQAITAEQIGLTLDLAQEDGKYGINGRVLDGLGGRWQFYGRLGRESLQGFESLQVTGTNVDLDRAVSGNLKPWVDDVWHRIRPEGTIREITARVTPDPEGGPLMVETEIDLNDVELGILAGTAMADLHVLKGKVRRESDGITVEGEADFGKPYPGGSRGRGMLKFQGSFGSASPQHAEERDHLSVQIEDMEVNPAFRETIVRLQQIVGRWRFPDDQAFQDWCRIVGEKLGARYDQLQPRGYADCSANLWVPRDGGETRVEGSLRVKGGSLNCPLPAWAGASRQAARVVGINGEVRFHNWQGDLNFFVPPEYPLKGTCSRIDLELFGEVTSPFRYPAWNLTATLPDLDVGGDILELLPALREKVAPHDLKGMVDVEIRSRKHRSDSPETGVRVIAEGKLSGSYAAFPYPLSRLRGSLRIEPQVLGPDGSVRSPTTLTFDGEGYRGYDQHTYQRNEGINAHSFGGFATFEFSGRVAGKGPESLVSLEVHGKDVPIDDALLQALALRSPRAREFLDTELHARGVGDVHYVARRGPETSGEYEQDIAVTLNAGAVRHASFPVDVGNLEGQLTIHNNELRVSETHPIQGQTPNGGEIVFSGRASTTGAGVLDLHIDTKQGSHLALDDFRAAFFALGDTRYVEIWRDYEPRGDVCASYRIWRADGEDLTHTRLELIPLGCNARATSFPYTLQNLSGGSIVKTDNRIELRHLVSRQNGAEITLDGWVETPTGDQEASRAYLEVQARRLALDAELRAALPPDAGAVWDDFDPSGTADVDAWVRVPGAQGQAVSVDVNVEFTGCEARYRHLPMALANVTGVLRVQDGNVQVEAFRASTSGGTLEVPSATVTGSGEDRAITFQARGESLRLADCIQAVLGPRGGVPTLLQPLTGGMDIRLDSAVVRGTDLANLTVQGEVSLTGVDLHGAAVDALDAKFVYRDRVLSVRNVTGEAYDGVLAGWFDLDTSAFNAYSVHAEARGLDLVPLARDLLELDRPTLAGRLSGTLDFDGSGPSLQAVVGRGELRVEDGYLWELPLFLDLGQAMDAQARQRLEGSKSSFRDVSLTFEVGDGAARFSQLAFDAGSLRVEGRGKMFLDGNLDLTMVAGFPKALPRIPFLSDAYKVVMENVIAVDVAGNVRKPRMVVQPLKLVTGTVSEVFDALGADLTETDLP